MTCPHHPPAQSTDRVRCSLLLAHCALDRPHFGYASHRVKARPAPPGAATLDVVNRVRTAHRESFGLTAVRRIAPPNTCAYPVPSCAWTRRCGDAVHPAVRAAESLAGARTALASARLVEDPHRHHSRPTARQRADAGLVEGRLVLLEVTDTQVRARWRGEGHVHRVTWTLAHGWDCTCQARSDQCSHLIALRRVVAVRPGVER